LNWEAGSYVLRKATHIQGTSKGDTDTTERDALPIEVGKEKKSLISRCGFRGNSENRCTKKGKRREMGRKESTRRYVITFTEGGLQTGGENRRTEKKRGVDAGRTIEKLKITGHAAAHRIQRKFITDIAKGKPTICGTATMNAIGGSGTGSGIVLKHGDLGTVRKLIKTSLRGKTTLGKKNIKCWRGKKGLRERWELTPRVSKTTKGGEVFV